jgi:hypothetical protein
MLYNGACYDDRYQQTFITIEFSPADKEEQQV